MVLALFSLLQTFSSDRTAPGWWTKHRSSVCGRCSDGCWRTLRWWTLSCDNERYADGDILSTGIDANWTICRYTLFGQFFSSVFPSPSILNWFRTCVAIDCPSVFTLASRGRIREQCSIWWQQYIFFFLRRRTTNFTSGLFTRCPWLHVSTPSCPLLCFYYVCKSNTTCSWALLAT